MPALQPAIAAMDRDGQRMSAGPNVRIDASVHKFAERGFLMSFHLPALSDAGQSTQDGSPQGLSRSTALDYLREGTNNHRIEARWPRGAQTTAGGRTPTCVANRFGSRPLSSPEPGSRWKTPWR